jgi:hypothetical protein
MAAALLHAWVNLIDGQLERQVPTKAQAAVLAGRVTALLRTGLAPRGRRTRR